MRFKSMLVMAVLLWAPSKVGAHDWASLTDVSWAPDESQFLLGYKGGGESSEIFLKRYDVITGRELKQHGGHCDETDDPACLKRFERAVHKAQEEFKTVHHFVPSGWLVPEPSDEHLGPYRKNSSDS